jgi:tetratricopeptide (TPR) repeat protein
MGRFTDAEATLKTAKGISDSNEVTVALALVRIRQGRGVEAMTMCQTLIDSNPEAAPPRYCFGAAARQAGKLPEAMASLRIAIERDPQLLDAYLDLAAVEALLEQGDDAVADLKRALRTNPRGSPPRLARLEMALGELYEASRRYEEARYTYEQARRYDPANVEAIAGSGRALRRLGRLDDALNELKPAATRYPKEAAVHAELAAVYIDYGLKPQALVEAKLALQLDAKRASDCYGLVLSALDPHQDTSDDGLRLLEQAGAVLTSDFDVQCRLGEAALTRQRWQTAIAAFRRAINIKPADPKANFGLGMAQLRSGDLAGARNACTALEPLDADKARDLSTKLAAATPAAAPTGTTTTEAMLPSADAGKTAASPPPPPTSKAKPKTKPKSSRSGKRGGR